MADSPLADNPLRTREDVRRAARDVIAPLDAHASPGGALIAPGRTAARFPAREEGIEGYSRSLWAATALTAGGGEYDGWDRYRRGLVNGTDPDHPEYWGTLEDGYQKVVETSGIGAALGLVPEELWEPLDADERENVAEWLTAANGEPIPDNNWRFFRVLANAGLRSVGTDHDWEEVREDLDRLEEFYLGDGWYADGPDAPCDHYSAWVMHVEALLYAEIAGEDDPERAARFRERAVEFADEFRYWFEPDGRALPYGRSLTYRFAQSAFWGALALAGRDADLPWGEVRGLWLRNLRWWADRPIFAEDGTLTLGYGYPTLKTTETYNSPASPYWACRAFLPLAVPADHPFWTAEERPLPDLDAERTLEHANMVVRRDEDHVVALTGGHEKRYPNKYDKYAYSTRFGFGVDDGMRGLDASGVDSTLVLSTDGEHWRGRSNDLESTVADGVAYSRWRPWPDVTGETWLAPAGAWHVRLHRLRSERALESAEGGFALDTSGEQFADDVEERDGDGEAAALAEGFSGVRAVGGEAFGGGSGDGPREGEVRQPDPNTNVLFPRALVPVLRGEHDPGEHWFATAVLGEPETVAEGTPDAWTAPPTVERDADGFRVLVGGDVRVERAFDALRPGE